MPQNLKKNNKERKKGYFLAVTALEYT